MSPTRCRAMSIASLALILLLGALGAVWVLAEQSVSPAQRVAEATPPKSVPITAAVERRALRETLATRGDIVAETTTDVHVSSVDGGETVVTSLPLDD